MQLSEFGSHSLNYSVQIIAVLAPIRIIVPLCLAVFVPGFVFRVPNLLAGCKREGALKPKSKCMFYVVVVVVRDGVCVCAAQPFHS